MKKYFIPFLALLFALTSCTTVLQVEKRHYRKGFYVSHNSSTISNHAIVPEKKQQQDYLEKKIIDDTLISQKDARYSENKTEQKKTVTTVERKLQSQFNKAVKVARQKFLSNEKPKPKEKVPADRNTRISKIMGVVAIIMISIGLIVIEAAAFGLVPILIGIFCASIGLKFGRNAMSYGMKRQKGSLETDDDLKRKWKKARRAYLLNMAAIFILAFYILIRVAIVIVFVTLEGGSAIIGFALLLLGICLLLFLFFKIGLFRDLKE